MVKPDGAKIQEVLTFAKEKHVQTVDLKFVSLIGRWHHVSIPVERLDEGFFSSGVAFDGSSIPGYTRSTRSDMTLIPDPSTKMLDPFWERPTLSLICDIYTGDGKAYARDPRGIARRAEEHMKSTGIADLASMSPEFEFHIFDSVRHQSAVNSTFYEVDVSEAEWNSGNVDGVGTVLPQKGGYHALPPQDRLYKLRDRIVHQVQDCGIPVKYHHHEVGGAGQSEIEVLFHPLLSAGDVTMTVKYLIRMLAHEEGKVATFMPKPLWNDAGNGMHVHQNLWLKGKPLFWDENGWAQLSETALYYIGGILHHGAALSALTNPSTNSYKRLVPGFEAPIHLIYGLANRSAAIRIPEAGNTPETKRIEFRPPDATCNIYLALAGMLMAGLDGIKNKINPKDLGCGPFDQSLQGMDRGKTSRVKTIPLTLADALVALEKDHEFLMEGDVFHEDTIQAWIERKRDEATDVRKRPHPREVALYFDA